MTVPENIKYVGGDAFEGCKNLTTVHWNAGISEVSSPFNNCTSISTVTFGENVEKVPDNLFYNCTGLTQVSFPASIDSIGYRAFYNTGLTEVTVPEHIKYVGSSAFGSSKNLATVHWNAVNVNIDGYSSPFSDCTSLSTVTFGESVKKVPNILFDDCTGLTQVSFPASIDSIGTRAFYNTGLTEVTVPENIKYVGGDAFEGCKNLTTVHWNAGISEVSSPFNNCTSISTVTFGENVEKVPDNLFYNCTGLTQVSFPASIDSIGYRAFYNTGLTEVTVPEHIKYVGSSAFGSSKNLATVHWNAVNVNIDGYSSPFSDCTSLSTVTFGESVKKVPNILFDDCTGLTQVSFPASIDSIGSSAFSNTGLTEVTIPENIKYVESDAFMGCKNLTTVHWNATHCEDFLYSSSSPFSNNLLLTTVTFGENVKKVPDNLFYGCTGLTAITFPALIDSIGSSAFSNTSLTEVTIPENIKYVGQYAFQGCENLATVYWNAVNSEVSSPFSGCSALSTVTFGASVEKVPDYLFSGYKTLTHITLANGVDSIGEYAFYRTSLSDLVIPQSLVYIGKSAFRECDSLRHLTFEPASTLEVIEVCAFYKSPLEGYEIPSSIRFIGENAFNGYQKYMKKLTITQSMVDTAYVCDIMVIDTLIIADDVKNIDFTKIFDDKVQIGYFGGILPDTMATWQLPIRPDGKHPYDVYQTVYDINGDGLMEFVEDDSKIYNYYGFSIDTVDFSWSRFSEFVNVRNGENEDIKLYYASYEDNYLRLFQKEKEDYQEYFRHATYEKYDVLDVNGDGLPDLFCDEDAFLQRRDGTFLPVNFKELTSEEVDSMIYQTEGLTGKGGMSASVVLGFSGYVVSGYVSEATSSMPARRVMDIDCNGYPDVLNLKNGNVWFNYGNNNCRKGNLGTKILAIKDLNGDGVTDLLVYDDETQEVRLVMYVDGELTSRVLTTDLIVTNAWCYDFDHDGDADILLAFDYQSNIGWSFLIFYRNDGNNEFKKKESAFEENLRFFECKDIDNDGMYEVLADMSQGYEYGNTRLIKCTHELVAELDSEPFFVGKSSNPMVRVDDFDGNGLIEYVYEIDNDHYGHYGLRRIPGKQNTPPTRMECPSIIFDGVAQKLNVSWTLGSDAESSPIDLTYALRIGSAPGKGDMLYANATSEGRRLNLEDGNMGSSLSTWIDVSNWPAGDYYLAVQAVDPNHMGGAWSEECVYHHDILSANFTADKLNLPSSDTLTVVYDGTEQEGYTYKWSLGDSVVVISSENTRHQLQYLSTGKKTISLQVFDAEGNASPVVMQEITVVPAKYEKFSTPDLLADWDMNGAIDGVSRNGFYANDGNGTFKGIGKSFNMNNTINLDYNPYITDYNRDGLVDLLAQSNKGNVYVNEGEQDFSIETVGTVLFDNSYYFIPDLDNDGLPDCYDLRYIYPGTEDLQYDFNRMAYLGYLGFGNIFFVDVDRDGYTDILYKSSIKDAEENWNLAFYIRRNQGNWSFTPEELIYTYPMNTSYVNVGDVDNDGYLDIVFVKNNYTLEVAYGDADNKYTDVREVYLPEKYAINTKKDESVNLFDVDNDGYLDVTFSACVVCFRPDRSYEVFTNENLDEFSSEELIMDMNGDGSPDSKEFLMRTGISNTAPEAPTNLRVLQNGDGVVLEWDDSYDRETPKIRMRYNVSLKKKGATGENSYIISPLNGENDEATIVPSHTYLESTRMVIPLKCFELGEEYEFRVQAIDLWNTVSPMSAPYEFTFEDQAVLIPLSEKVCARDLLEFHYDVTSDGTPQWDTDGGELFENEDRVFMSWTTGGTKKVSLTMNGKTVTRSIYVIPEDTTDLTFTLPPMVLGECNIPFTLPEVCRDPSNKVSITTSSPDVVVERRGSSLDARVRFPAKEGVYTVTLEYDANTSCGSHMYTQSVMVNGTNVKPVISIVSVDGLTGKTTIQWDIPNDVLNNPIFDKIIVYKEEGRTNNFVKLAELPLTEHQFVDFTSDPSVRKSRYRITLGTTYGGESNPSDVHSNVHVMLNKGLNNAVNIMWSEYEGALIDQYIIWRGTSLDNMQVLTTASGSETSFTDFTAPEGENLYYALSYSNVYETEWIKYTASYPAMAYSVMAYSAANVAEGFSNFTTTNEGIVAMLPTSLSIVSLEKVMELTPEQSVIHLLADLLPTTTTVKQVRWSITEGAEFAQINSNGTLQYKGTGETEWLTVFAETIDGSNLSATARIPVKGFDSQEPENPEPENPSSLVADSATVSIKVYPNPTHGDFVIDGISERAEVYVYSLDGLLMMKKPIEGRTDLSIANLSEGSYILVIMDEKGNVLARRKIVKQ